MEFEHERRLENGHRKEQHADMRDVVERLATMEQKVDVLVRHMERATGAWLFIKIMGSIVVGFTIVYAFIMRLFPE